MGRAPVRGGCVAGSRDSNTLNFDETETALRITFMTSTAFSRSVPVAQVELDFVAVVDSFIYRQVRNTGASFACFRFKVRVKAEMRNIYPACERSFKNREVLLR